MIATGYRIFIIDRLKQLITIDSTLLIVIIYQYQCIDLLYRSNHVKNLDLERTTAGKVLWWDIWNETFLYFLEMFYFISLLFIVFLI